MPNGVKVSIVFWNLEEVIRKAGGGWRLQRSWPYKNSDKLLEKRYLEHEVTTNRSRILYPRRGQSYNWRRQCQL